VPAVLLLFSVSNLKQDETALLPVESKHADNTFRRPLLYLFVSKHLCIFVSVSMYIGQKCRSSLAQGLNLNTEEESWRFYAWYANLIYSLASAYRHAWHGFFVYIFFLLFAYFYIIYVIWRHTIFSRHSFPSSIIRF